MRSTRPVESTSLHHAKSGGETVEGQNSAPVLTLFTQKSQQRISHTHTSACTRSACDLFAMEVETERRQGKSEATCVKVALRSGEKRPAGCLHCSDATYKSLEQARNSATAKHHPWSLQVQEQRWIQRE